MGSKCWGELYENNFRLRLAVPASLKAISSVPRLRSYVELCRTIPEHLRRFLAVELTDLPAGVPHARLAELATHLRPLFGLVNATVDWWRCDFSQYANIGIRIVNAVMTNEPTTTTTLATRPSLSRTRSCWPTRELTVWFTAAAIAVWQAEPRTTPGQRTHTRRVDHDGPEAAGRLRPGTAAD
jgi:hypothetical protein